MNNEKKSESEPIMHLTVSPYMNQSAPDGVPEDFFPSEVGLKWTYEITLGNVEPQTFEERMWEQSDKKYLVSYTSHNLVGEKGKDNFLLIFKIKSIAAKQRLFPKGVELEILQDDLNIFQGTLNKPKEGFLGNR